MTKNTSDYSDNCSGIVYQRATVNANVFVKPYMFVGSVNTLCCTEPTIANLQCKHQDNKQICCFTISQEICVEIPVHFGAEVCTGEPWIDCCNAVAEPCGDCDTEEK